MTVEHIIPCVCIPHPPTVADRFSYGMPVLTPYGRDPHKQFWTVKCPVCGRGGCGIEEPSAYKALRHWNRIMESCYRMEGKDIVLYDDNWEQYYDAKSGRLLDQYKSGWDNI